MIFNSVNKILTRILTLKYGKNEQYKIKQLRLAFLKKTNKNEKIPDTSLNLMIPNNLREKIKLKIRKVF